MTSDAHVESQHLRELLGLVRRQLAAAGFQGQTLGQQLDLALECSREVEKLRQELASAREFMQDGHKALERPSNS